MQILPCSHKMKLFLKQLTALVERTDKTEEMLERITNLADNLVSLMSSTTPDGETPNPVKLLQAHLKCTLFNSEAIKGKRPQLYLPYYLLEWKEMFFALIFLHFRWRQHQNISEWAGGLLSCQE